MPERVASRTASIPSKHRGRRPGTEMYGSLVVRKLEGMTSPDNTDITSILDGVVIPNSEAVANINASRLKADLKKKLSNSEQDQRSLEFLIRLLKTSPFARDVTNDENRQPADTSPVAPPPSLHNVDVTHRADDVSEPVEYVMTKKSTRNSSPLSKIRPVTTESSTRFRKSIEQLKGARERFGVCMSVNGTIAKARNLQQKNQMNRKAGRDKLPVLNGSTSSECSDSEKPLTTPRKYGVIAPLGPWLALSGRKIQLKHQGHVERVLDQPERVLTRPEYVEVSRDFRKRNSRSAPPRGSVKAIPIRRYAWGDGNRFVIQKVNKSFQYTMASLDFSASYHGVQTTTQEENTKTESVPTTTPEIPTETGEKDPIEKPIIHVTEEAPKSQQARSSPSSHCTSNDSSRPSSSSMPRPVRSVVIKLPTTGIVTSPSASLPNMTSSSMVNQKLTTTLPPRPYVRFDSLRKPL